MMERYVQERKEINWSSFARPLAPQPDLTKLWSDIIVKTFETENIKPTEKKIKKPKKEEKEKKSSEKKRSFKDIME